MKRLHYSFFILLFTSGLLQAQFIDYLPLSKDYDAPGSYIAEIPLAKIKNYGFGNYGFDSQNAFYNPKYFADSSRLTISVSSAFGFWKRDHLFHGGANLISKDKQTALPDLTVRYRIRRLLFSLLYKSDAGLEQSFNEGVSLNYATSNGLYRTFFEPAYEIENKALQLSASLLLKRHISLTLGLLSNHFLYRIKGENHFSFSFERAFFDNYQALAALNFSYPAFSFYLFGKTQQGALGLSAKAEGITGEMIWPAQAKISYPALLAYGFQFKVLQPLKFSLEFAHEIMNYKDKQIGDAIKDKSVFNTEAIAGANITLPHNLQVGLLVSYYLKYQSKTGLQMLGNDYKAKTAKLSNPLSGQFSVRYRRDLFYIGLWYQYAFAEYDMLKNDEGDRRFKDSAQFFNLSIGVNLW